MSNGGDTTDGEAARLAAALRSCTLGVADPPLDAIAALLTERAPILSAILGLDPDALSPSARSDLAEALSEARDHDARITAALVAAQADASAALNRLVDARGAARGYRGPRSNVGALLRTA